MTARNWQKLYAQGSTYDASFVAMMQALEADLAALAGGSTGVQSVSATDTSIAVAGTATAVQLATGRLDQITAAHPPTAAVDINSQLLSNVHDPSGPQDADTKAARAAAITAAAASYQPVDSDLTAIAALTTTSFGRGLLELANAAALLAQAGALAATSTLNAIATANATTADIAMNTHKLTGLSAGSTSGDSVRYEQAVKSGDSAGGDLTGTYPNPTLGTAGPGATGPTGDATHAPAVTIDAKGRVTGLTSVAITGTAPGGSASGDLTGTYPSPTLVSSGPGAVGPIGDATHVAAVTTDAKGRVSALTSVAITGTAPGGSAGGDLTGTYPSPTLATAGPGATGPIGDSTHVSTVTIDAKGRVTALSSTAIVQTQGPFGNDADGLGAPTVTVNAATAKNYLICGPLRLTATITLGGELRVL